MAQEVRVRFAPSPTGMLHLGGIRTALFNWLFARQNKGKFILRFEDTDQARLVPDAMANTQEALEWLGLEWDEGPSVGGPHEPYVQSKRLKTYKKFSEQLIKSGRLYRDWTTPEELEKMRQQAQKQKKPFRVDRQELKTEGDPSQPHVLRFKVDESYNPKWNDFVRGQLSQPAKELDDFVAVKSDGFPTYNFANVIDDHQMDISHVIRGEEFISSTPKFLQVYKAFGWRPPTYAHLPPVLGPDKAKLSKRHGAEPVLSYRARGYLPEAIINFLALLGWNPGSTQEVFNLEELVSQFSLERTHKSPAVFDSQRLDWFNGIYIRQFKLEDLAGRAKRFWPVKAKEFEQAYRKRVLALVQERIKYLGELPDLTSFFFVDPSQQQVKDTFSKHKLVKKLESSQTKDYLVKSKAALSKIDFGQEKIESSLRRLADSLNVKTGVLFMVLRVAVCGTSAAPPLFETLSLIGKERVLSRLERAAEIL